MAKVSEIFEKLALRAPVELKMGFDNVGHLAGRGDREARRVLVTLDITGISKPQGSSIRRRRWARSSLSRIIR